MILNMKKLSFIISTLLLSFSSSFAQGPGGPPPPDGRGKERVEALKVGFITDRLNLTPEEAAGFWPVYNQYQDELERLRKNRKENLMNARKDPEGMTDAEVEKMVDGEIAFRQAELDLVKKYNPQFKKVLPMKKVGRLYRAEEEFKRELLQKLQDRRDDRRPGGRR